MTPASNLHLFVERLSRDWPRAILEGRLGNRAVPLYEDFHALLCHPAPAFDAMARNFMAQQSGSACSLASVTLALNALSDHEPPLSQDDMLASLDNQDWLRQTAEGGDGVKFAELVERCEAAIRANGLSATVSSCQPASDPGIMPNDLSAFLDSIQTSADDIVLIYFNQGVVTGDWDGPHVCPVGAYDRTTDRILVMEVDRELNLPYWSSTGTVYEAMLKPVRPDHGRLAGEVGGWVHLHRERT